MTLQESRESEESRLFDTEDWRRFDPERFPPTRRKELIAEILNRKFPFILTVSKEETGILGVYCHESVISRWGKYVKLGPVYTNENDPDSFGVTLQIGKEKRSKFNTINQDKEYRIVQFKHMKWPFKWPQRGLYTVVQMATEKQEDDEYIIEIHFKNRSVQ